MHLGNGGDGEAARGPHTAGGRGPRACWISQAHEERETYVSDQKMRDIAGEQDPRDPEC